MIWDSIEFVGRETALQLRRERLIAIATVSTVAVLLLLVGAIILFLLDLRFSTNHIARELEVKAFFHRDFPRAAVQQAERAISRWPEVLSARFMSREQAWQDQKRTFPGMSALRGIDNPLSDGVVVRVKKPESVARVAKKLAGVVGVKDVVPTAEEARGAGSVARRVATIQRAVSWAVILVSALVVIASTFIVHNTVRLALHARWREIYIMQLVGAARAMVAAPFLLEGAAHGVLGAVLTCCVLIPLHMYLGSLARRSYPSLFLLVPDSTLLPVALCVIAAGGFLGITGSMLSIRRYFRRRPGWQT